MKNLMTKSLLAGCLLAISISGTQAQNNKGEAQLRKSMAQLYAQLQTLQREVRDLRGKIEEQNNTISNLRRELAQQYTDLDKRINLKEETTTSMLDLTQSGETPINSVEEPFFPESGAQNKPNIGSSSETNSEASAYQENSDYEEAFNLASIGKYRASQRAFGNFLEKYPNSNYSNKANYWLAEVLYAQKKYAQSLETFEAFLDKYPDSVNRQQALLKMGYIYDRQGKKSQARKTFDEILTKYPNSDSAELARQRLARLKK